MKAFLVEITPEMAKKETREISITVPGVVWALLGQIAGNSDISPVCQEIFEAGLNALLKIQGVGLTAQEAVGQTAPGGMC